MINRKLRITQISNNPRVFVHGSSDVGCAFDSNRKCSPDCAAMHFVSHYSEGLSFDTYVSANCRRCKGLMIGKIVDQVVIDKIMEDDGEVVE
jgi:hypothetical protein